MIKLEPLRQAKDKGRYYRLLEENVGKENYDGNRLEQELIYYIEKIDISEEQVRLKNHCEYFKTMLAEQEESKGKETFVYTTGDRQRDQYHRFQGIRFHHPEMRGADER